ncbi:hypothetical protein J6590_080857 [Homalodisca vitripennis]|nr:hypothetical protein J6590_080857 [Homalodisca vitripennis]
MLNSRPIVPFSLSPNDLEPPSHGYFLVGGPLPSWSISRSLRTSGADGNKNTSTRFGAGLTGILPSIRSESSPSSMAPTHHLSPGNSIALPENFQELTA